MIKAKAALVLTALLATTFFPSTAHARDLAIWDQLQGTNPKGYVLLMRHALAPGIGDPENFNVNHRNTRGLLVMVGHSVNIQTLTGTSLDSGEGVLLRATQQGELKVMGYSPAP